jgi:hypothetical protein
MLERRLEFGRELPVGDEHHSNHNVTGPNAPRAEPLFCAPRSQAQEQ